MSSEKQDARTLGLLGATGVGVGAIVGGGILALAGVAFVTSGPGAIAAFAVNGAIALLTALTFAEMSAGFPESGGTYTFAKKVLSVEAAFLVGWVVWFASIVAAALYALGFASYALVALGHLGPLLLGQPLMGYGRPAAVALAAGATAFYTSSLLAKTAGGGRWATAGKVAVFIILVAGGLWTLGGEGLRAVGSDLRPFLPSGFLGMFQAMGYTFIALQGFDLIAAVGGEVRDPTRNIPRAMLLSLGVALAIYLPFLLVIATVGVQPGQSISAMSAEQPETVVAAAVENYLGPAGLWLVIVAAILSMLSALHANLYAASRVALAMARDRTLPGFLGALHARRGTPFAAILATALLVTVILVAIPDVAAAGAAASLIFLISFALAHITNILFRQRTDGRGATFRVPWYPAVPVTGGLACVVLAVFQGVEVRSAGAIATVWLALGAILYFFLFARRASVVDASAQALDPDLVRLRGRNPLVLVPIANPASAAAMVRVASALALPKVGRVLMLSVVAAPETWQPDDVPAQLVDAQTILRETLTTSFAAGLAPEALTTVAPKPWAEISRVSRLHRCESLVIGFTKLRETVIETDLEDLIGTVDSDVVVVRAPSGWRLDDVREVLVPVGGRRDHSKLRARLLGSLSRAAVREIVFVGVLPERVAPEVFQRAYREMRQLAADEAPGTSRVEVVRSSSVADELIRRASESDLVVLGLQRLSRRRKVFGEIPMRLVRETSCPIILISGRG